MFDSPMEFCPKCGQMVVLDQARAECGRKLGCGIEPEECPLQKYFTRSDAELDPPEEDRPIAK